jgi:DNA-binding NtrC family response regulator
MSLNENRLEDFSGMIIVFEKTRNTEKRQEIPPFAVSPNMNQKIAFIDDERGVLESIRWVFKGEPYRIFTFQDPLEALEQIEKDGFAVVVADQVMPEMEGSLLLERVKKRDPRTECMIMTGHDHLVDDLKNTAGRVIIKPWDVEELKSIISKAVSRYEADNLDDGPAKKTILYVDNDDSIISVVERIMSRLGYAVVGTALCSDAIRMMQARPDRFDLVITDMKMPDMDGLELTAELMKIRPGIPVILCTGYSDLADDPAVKAAGIRAILPKPFGVGEISGLIREVLDGH